MKRIISGCIGFVCLFSAVASADVKLPAIISDNMVIQADISAPIWGWAESGEKVTVAIGGQKQTAIADANGKWTMKLVAMKVSDKPVEMTVSGKNSITVKNILIGQVWLGSGQSNMEMPVTGYDFEKKGGRDPGVLNVSAEVSSANYSLIRLFTVGKVISDKPLADCNGSWVVCSPETIKNFSATLYFFGRDIFKELAQPVGLIHSSWGGTPIESWTSKSALESEPAAKPTFENWDKAVKAYPQQIENYKKSLAKWEHDANEARAAGKPLPKKPAAPLRLREIPQQPFALFNGMIAPIIPFEIKGVVWYQGESNAGQAWRYRKLFGLMIADWRQRWQEGNFPFYFVQIANFNSGPWFPELTWAELRQSQLETMQTVTNTGMAVTIDIGEANYIHPRNKQEVGRRLALWALAKTYGKNVECCGPIYQGMKIEGNKIVISFTHAEGGLAAKGDSLKEFKIAGADKKFVPAKAVIEKQTVVVSSPDVNSPAAVRYAWSNNPAGANLYNEAGLPASPFKTDDWTWETEKAK